MPGSQLSPGFFWRSTPTFGFVMEIICESEAGWILTNPPSENYFIVLRDRAEIATGEVAGIRQLLDRLPWSSKPELTFARLPKEMEETVVKVACAKGFELASRTEAIHYILLDYKEEACKSRLQGIVDEFNNQSNNPLVFRAVSGPSDAQLVDSLWIYHNETTIHYIRRCLERRPGVGIAQAATGRLVAWTLVHLDGSLGALHVCEGYRGMRLGLVVTAQLVLELLEQLRQQQEGLQEENATETVAAGPPWQKFTGMPPNSDVVVSNAPAHRIMKDRLGMSPAFSSAWLHLRPKSGLTQSLPAAVGSPPR